MKERRGWTLANALPIGLAALLTCVSAVAAEDDHTPSAGSAAPAAEPPPAPPTAAEQSGPAPYLAEPPPDHPVRYIELGPLAGVTWRPAQGNAQRYPAAFAYGATLRFNFVEWLGLRLVVLRSTQAVDPDALSGGRQPDLDVRLLAARVEGSLRVLPRLRASAGLSAGWLLSLAPPIEGGPIARARLGNGFELGAALSGAYDIWPNRVALSATFGGAVITDQRGDMFRSIDAIDTNGHRTTVAPLPEYAGALCAVLGVEVAL